MHALTDATALAICDFLREIGLEVRACELPETTFLPGLRIERGALLVDGARLRHPGDLLHEAGHLAVTPAAARPALGDDVAADLGDEMAAIGWSYAAAVHLRLDPAVVFHAEGYRGSSQGFLDNFRAGRYVAVPLLQWMGLCLDSANAEAAGAEAYPRMVRWLRE
jgi:hypothetical protein